MTVPARPRNASGPPDPHLLAVATYADTLHRLGYSRADAVRRASRALPRTQPQPPTREITYLFASQPDTASLALIPTGATP